MNKRKKMGIIEGAVVRGRGGGEMAALEIPGPWPGQRQGSGGNEPAVNHVANSRLVIRPIDYRRAHCLASFGLLSSLEFSGDSQTVRRSKVGRAVKVQVALAPCFPLLYENSLVIDAKNKRFETAAARWRA